MVFKTILHATDFSDTSLRALHQARKLARYHGAKLHILHVQVILEARYPMMAGALMNSRDERSQELLQALVPEDDDDTVLATVEHTRASVAIAEYAESNDVDLIVVGSHGYSGIDRLLLGSEAQRLIRHSSIPVLVARSDAWSDDTAEKPFSRLLAAVDFSDASGMALQEADKLASLYGASLTVLHSLDVVMPTHYAYVTPSVQMPLARQALGKFVTDAALTTTPEQLVSAESAAASILNTVRSEAIDLIVIARSGMSGWQRFLVGSTTARVLNGATCDVLVLPTGAA